MTHHRNYLNSTSIELRNRRIFINGTAKMVLAGEVHYFRLHPNDWNDRLQRLQDSGLDTVSTYVPWLWHELPDGSVDLVGATHPQRNLVAFLELCASRGLRVIARPGPFVMAELKNEGIPYRLYQAPFHRPHTWDAATIPTHTLDYLAPDFLAAVRGWYAQVMPVIAEHLCTRGGPIIAVQLDNEIGMLSWVSNSPDLTDVVCEDMRRWCRERYSSEVASERIGADASDPVAWAKVLRSPGEASLPLHHDLGLYMRDRFSRYVQELRLYAEENGVCDVPFLINIAGTGGGRGTSFPICISQLYESYRHQAQMTAGSDQYLGELTVANLPDLYLLNAFMLAVQNRHQPLTSMEFEAGNGNYGDDLGNLCSPESTVLKTRLCVAQGNRGLNYYLHAGGENPPLPSVGDGIDRIAFTGQRHGFAAPVGPDGQLNATYAALGAVVKSMRSIEHLLAESLEEHDDLAIGFAPDQYMTEFHYPASAQRAAQIADLERFRGAGPSNILVRALLLNGFSFPAVDLQIGIPKTPALVFATGRTLGAAVQTNLATYVQQGGKLLLAGLLPDQDHDGAPCTVLAEALGLKSAGIVSDGAGLNGQAPYWPTVAASGWAAPRADERVGVAQLLASCRGEQLEPLLTELSTGLPCAVQVQVGRGQVLMLGCDYPADLAFYKQLLAALGVVPRWQLAANGPGVVLLSTQSKHGQRLLHVLNVAPQPVSFTLHYRGKKVLNGKKLTVQARKSLILPLGVFLKNASLAPSLGKDLELEPISASSGGHDVGSMLKDGAVILESTAEIVRQGRESLTVMPSQEEDLIVLKTRRTVRCAIGKIRRRGDRVEIVLPRKQHRDKTVRITFHKLTGLGI